MRIEEALQIALFENFRDFKKIYDEIMNIFSESQSDISPDARQQFRRQSRQIEAIFENSNQLGFNEDHVIDIYARLFRSNVTFLKRGGNEKASREEFDLNALTKKFSDLLKVFNSSEGDISRKSLIFDTMSGSLNRFHAMLLVTLRELIFQEEEKENKNAFEILFKSSDWILFEPEKRAASCRLGSGTKWCISSRGENNLFDAHKKDNDVYIIHTDNEKYAIIVRRDSRKIVEVQKSANDFREITPELLKSFFEDLEEDGVDLDILEDEINAKIPESQTIGFQAEGEFSNLSEREQSLQITVKAFDSDVSELLTSHQTILNFSSENDVFVTNEDSRPTTIRKHLTGTFARIFDERLSGFLISNLKLVKKLSDEIVEELDGLDIDPETDVVNINDL